MLHHFVTTTERAYVVVYQNNRNQTIVICECLSEKQANQEAARLNYEQQAIEAVALEKARAAYFRPRRAVRQFEDDVFA